MNNKGFTLAEILAVIILIALISVVSVSSILNRVNATKSEISDANKTLILTATQFYISDNQLKYEKKEGNIYCIYLQDLIDEELLSAPILDISGKEISTSTIIKASYLNNDFVLSYDEKDCKEIK
ncbi:MAG: type II secretion system GspH family protein [Clostridium sp.]|nr:type II secretion system GspH family protein [Clostridium sp.]MCM1444731.1 type II secretion system GspH family protein [Candidatus Amulumruptor caecigallinarius]